MRHAATLQLACTLLLALAATPAAQDNLAGRKLVITHPYYTAPDGGPTIMPMTEVSASGVAHRLRAARRAGEPTMRVSPFHVVTIVQVEQPKPGLWIVAFDDVGSEHIAFKASSRDEFLVLFWRSFAVVGTAPTRALSFAIRGVVKDNQTKARIAGARVRARKKGGRTIQEALTQRKGKYALKKLSIVVQRMTVSHPDYKEKDQRFRGGIDEKSRINFVLRKPITEPQPFSFAGSISGGARSCGDFLNTPCKRHFVTVIGRGQLQATLTWSNRNNDLDLELWSGTRRLARSADVFTTQENVSARVSAGRYELRVLYFLGGTTQSYQLGGTTPPEVRQQ